jgi:hypothetical protein
MLRMIAEIAIGNASNAPAIGQNRCVNCVGMPMFSLRNSAIKRRVTSYFRRKSRTIPAKDIAANCWTKKLIFLTIPIDAGR